jgi:hypothetical protein
MPEGETNKRCTDWLSQCGETFRNACVDVAAWIGRNLSRGFVLCSSPASSIAGLCESSLSNLLVTHLKTVPDLTQIIQVDIPGTQLVEFMEGFIDRGELKSSTQPEWTQSIVGYPKTLGKR